MPITLTFHIFGLVFTIKVKARTATLTGDEFLRRFYFL